MGAFLEETGYVAGCIWLVAGLSYFIYVGTVAVSSRMELNIATMFSRIFAFFPAMGILAGCINLPGQLQDLFDDKATAWGIPVANTLIMLYSVYAWRYLRDLSRRYRKLQQDGATVPLMTIERVEGRRLPSKGGVWLIPVVYSFKAHGTEYTRKAYVYEYGLVDKKEDFRRLKLALYDPAEPANSVPFPVADK